MGLLYENAQWIINGKKWISLVGAKMRYYLCHKKLRDEGRMWQALRTEQCIKFPSTIMMILCRPAPRFTIFSPPSTLLSTIKNVLAANVSQVLCTAESSVLPAWDCVLIARLNLGLLELAVKRELRNMNTRLFFGSVRTFPYEHFL